MSPHKVYPQLIVSSSEQESRKGVNWNLTYQIPLTVVNSVTEVARIKTDHFKTTVSI